ncbi:MAG TPA: 3-oxoacyl-ACP reductase FabG [Gammaproteobacteria bacterium]|nr:3-oxoacyl-ACP reductase FabG [Gammaproteobacteria bacterium]
MSFENQIALVTGASRGIGKAIAEVLGRRGATVIGTATSERGAQAISEALAAAGIKGEGKVLDVTDQDSIAALVKDVTDNYGSPGILVNNAGITRDNLLMRMKDEEWDEVIETNLTAAFRMCRACLRGMMKARYGRIIMISSVIGATGNPGQANYAATKAGVIGFAKSLAREIGSRGITVNAVAPGFIDTDMTRALPDEQRAALLDQIALGRLGDVSDIANTVAFLASSDAGYITGETIHVNGGMYMH